MSAVYEKAAEVSDHAADLLDLNGWCRGAFRKANGHMCTMGAIDQSLTDIFGPGWAFDSTLAQDTRRVLIKQLYKLTLIGPIFWNDKQRDKRKVTRLLRRSARNLRNGA